MSKYVMSDIHGCYDKFIEMINLINFKENDELYIIGDIFDRGDKPLEILEYIINHKNITLLLGNHEYMALNTYNSDFSDIYLWLSNGGKNTYESLQSKEQKYSEAVINYLKKLPLIIVVDKFILVHGNIFIPENNEEIGLSDLLDMQDKDFVLWERPIYKYEETYKDYTVICGHTPVQSIIKNSDTKILKGNQTIYIDCGCVFGKKYNGKLACLRLDDMQEFYITNIIK